MALLNLVGAETGDVSEVAVGGGTRSASSAWARSGAYSLRWNPTVDSASNFINKHGADGKFAVLGETAVWATFYLYLTALPGAGGEIRIYLGGIGSPAATLTIDSAGALKIVGTSTSGTVATLATATEYRIDFRAATSGTCGVAVNKGAETTVTGNANNIDYLAFTDAAGAQTYDAHVDDIWIDDAAFPVDDYGIAIAVPTGNSATNTGWTASAGDKFACIDEIPPTNTEEITSGTGAGDQRYSATHATAATLGINGSILGVKVVARMSEVSSTTTLGRIGIRSGSSNFETTDVDIGNTSDVTMAKVYESDPNTSAAWTESGFNAAEPLVVRSTSDTSDIACSALYLMVLVAITPVLVPSPFSVEWTGYAPTLVSKAVAKVTSTLQWALGGSASQQKTLQWALGGRASQSRTLQWRVAPSPLRVHYALTGRSGPVTYAFRFERRTIANQFLQDVTPAVLGGSIEANNDRDVFRTATFTIDASVTDDRGNAVTIDPLADHIAVFMDLLVDGSYTLGLPMGLFALNVPRKRFEPGMESWEVTASDNGIHLMEATTTAAYTVAASANYLTGTNAVRDILNDLGLAHALPTTTLTLPVARTWPAGTPWLRVVNDLLHAAGMYSLWFDAQGVARARAYDDLSTRTPDVTYTGEDFVLIPITEDSETTRLANQVVAVVDDPSRSPLSSVKTNADPDSPISTISLGRTITKVLNSDAADQTTLDAIAENYLRNEAGLYRRAAILTSIDPRRDAHEVYELTVDGVYAAERWWARNWVVQLTIETKQKHTLGKVERVVAS